MAMYIGLDVGGTKIEGVLVNGNLRVFKRVVRPTEAQGSRERIVSNIISVMKELEIKDVKGIGIGVPGFSDSRGRMRLTPNLKKFENFNLKGVLQKRLNRKIVMVNDAHCFVLAEQKAGAARNLRNVIGLTLGTGVGGGAIIEGRLYRGKSGGAAHFGHMIVDGSGERCECGLKGDLESWCGGRHMERRYKSLTGKGKSLKEIFSSKDAAAKKIVSDFYEKLGIAIANLISAFNPECVVLGGSVSKSVDLGRLAKAVASNGQESLVKDAKIVKNKLGASAGVYGAALLASQSPDSSSK